MTKKIFKYTMAVAAIVLLASLGIITGVLYHYFSEVEETQLKEELSIAEAAVESGGEDALEDLSLTSYRITWIATDGDVIYDTASNHKLENHYDREEVQQALTEGEGSSTRYSSTLMQQTMYYAERMDDGTVLRISVSRDSVAVLLFGMLQPILAVFVVALIVSALLARSLAKKVVEPLNNLDLDNPMENMAYDEIVPLLRRINKQHIQISDQMRALQRRTDEFDQITGSMNEGLVLLDAKGVVLSINPAAEKVFDADDNVVGKDFIILDRSRDLNQALETAMRDGHCEIRGERNGREYQFDITKIESEGEAVGAVILAFDITEQAFAERSRREFSANVSHELKTPLQGIIGSAELIENHMVKEDDIPRFIGHIRTEAARLVTLIEDIIRLSQLDEEESLDFEPVDMSQICAEAVQSVKDSAAAKDVTFNMSGVSGPDATVMGVSRLLYEVVYNLCDNAIKYNVSGGKVDVDIENITGVAGEKSVAVTVKDTGIGIAPEHHSRIFERFYRVDKSHSKASGGTGLGLSIVKHAVQLHKGHIDIESAQGEGTTISVIIPAADKD